MDTLSSKVPEQANDHYPEWFIKTHKTIYYILGVIEALLGLRLIFKLLGANQNNQLISSLYFTTKLLIAPFSGILGTAIMQGNKTQYIFESSTVIAMIIYALIAYGLIRLIEIKVSTKK